MAHLLVVILYNPTQLPGLLEAWHTIDVPGVTILSSAGGYRARNWLQQVGLGRIGDLFGAEDVRSRTLLTVIEDDDLLERAIIEAERAIGDFFQPGSGLLFVVPVSRVLGILSPENRAKAIPPPLETKHPEAMTDMELVTRDTPVSVVDKILNVEPFIIQADQSLIEVAEEIANAPNKVRHVACVVNERQRLVGLLTLQNLADDLFMLVIPEEFLSEAHDRDHAMQYAKLAGTHTVGEAMIPAVWVTQDDTVKVAFRKMHENQLSGIPIVNDRYEVIGYINLLELLAIYARSQQTSES